MTGQEHYEAAERLLEAAADTPEIATSALLAGRAQVHATLAMAAADERIAEDDDRLVGALDPSGTRFRVGTAAL